MQEQLFFIPGPAGLLELRVNGPIAAGQPVVVMCHPHPLYGGSMDNKVVTTVCKSFAELGYASVRFNFRGIGQSQGSYADGAGEKQDALAVLTWLQSQYAVERVILAGFSFGAFVALATCQQFSAAHLLLIAPPVEYPEFAELNAPAHWSLITAGADEVIRTPAILAWANRQNPPAATLNIEDASHFFHGRLHLLKEFIRQYFSR